MKIKKFTSRQLEKIAEQLRLLSWGQGAILISQYGLNLGTGWISKLTIVGLWLMCQIIAFLLDGKVEK